MNYLSVCSGIEAATVAWHGLGWTPVAFAEIEAFPAAVLAHHYPTVPNMGDLTKYRDWPDELLAQVELLVGGTPCQAFSVAGQRRSLDDERGNLSLIYVNLFHHINEVRKRHGRSPAIALWENVPGCLSTKDNAFGCIIGGLLGCDEAPATESGKWDKAGFLGSETVRVGYRVLDAQYFGVAQRRRRVFLVAVPCELVASLGERACPSEILSLRESVLGNPPTRGAAWEGVARDATACAASRSGCGEPFYLDRASFNQGENAQYDPQITNDGVAGSAVARGPAAIMWSASDQANARDSQDTFVTCFHPTQDPISSTDGSTHAVSTGSGGGCATHAVCVTGQRSHALTTRSAACEEDGTGRGTPIVTHGGVFDGAVAVRTANTGANGHGVADEVSHTIDQAQGQAVAFPINADADRQNSAALTPSPDAEGRIRLRDPGIGIGDNGDPMFTMQSTKPHAVAFKPGQSEAAGGTFVTEEFNPTVQAQNNGSTAVPAVAFTKSKRAQSNTDDESRVPGDIAPTQNQFDQGETRATTVVAFANRTRDGIKVPEVMKDGVVPALTNPGGGGRSDAVNVVAFKPGQGAESRSVGASDEVCCTLEGSANGNAGHKVAVQSAMQVRRLTPTECAHLQGFPADYLDITFRKKPAADGPKYRALGNSMAVPCMWWLGMRIDNATRRDIP